MSYAKRISEIQMILDDTILLLAEIRAKPGISRLQKSNIDTLIGELQDASRSLPPLAKDGFSLKVVSKLVKFAIDYWKKFHSES